MVEEEIVENEPVNKELWLKVIIGSLSLIAWIVVIVLRQTTEVSLLIPVTISAIISIAFIISLFGKGLYEKFKTNEPKNKIPEPLSKEKVDELLGDLIINRKNNMIRVDSPRMEKTYNINNNVIYAYTLELYHEEDWMGEITPYVIVIVNATYPEIKPTIMKGTSPAEEILANINAISRNPKEDPDTEQTVVDNPILGTRSTTIKKIHRENPKTEEKEESLV